MAITFPGAGNRMQRMMVRGQCLRYNRASCEPDSLLL